MNGDLKSKLAGRLVIASISGGKDSAALSLWLHEQGIEHRRVFQDTGWEHPATLEWLRGDLTRAIGPIEEIRGPETLSDLVLRKGMFPSRKRRFCTEELKIKPMQAYIANLDCDVVNAVGIRHDESAARAAALEWEWSSLLDCEVWRPLIHWTVDDVIAIHKRHGLTPNPLYLRGAERVGCWPCINVRKAELRLIADTDPDRIERIAELESDVTIKARARWERERSEWMANPPPRPADAKKAAEWDKTRRRLFDRPFSPPAFFQARVANEHGEFPCWPIEKVVQWARTSHGGRQFELFAADPSEAGCMRWGLCDTAARSGGI